MAQLRHIIRDEIKLPVGIDQGKNRAGNGEIRQFLVRIFRIIFHHIRQKLELVHQMRELRRIDLSEFHFQKRQLVMDARQYLGGDFRGTVMNKL